MAAIDLYSESEDSIALQSPAKYGVSASLQNSGELEYVTRALYVGVTGDVKVTLAGGASMIFGSVPAGTFLPVRAKQVWATSTAQSIIALW